MRAHVDAARQREPHGALHDEGIARMESAGHVGRGQYFEQRFVVAHAPGPVALAQVGIEVDVHAHSGLSGSSSSTKGVP